ncbi:hypothetical protein [Bacillus taeanensis]|uniref:hypothetical protein n=1 Tax=Bacillus taeanensis TaxID=273032 RepID=UPI0015F094C4|nr:hypothetical protein [Bacillus taeanensis]
MKRNRFTTRLSFRPNKNQKKRNSRVKVFSGSHHKQAGKRNKEFFPTFLNPYI